jgi:hypothetical protein
VLREATRGSRSVRPLRGCGNKSFYILCKGRLGIEIQAADGDIGEVEAEVWAVLPLELAELPEDWGGSIKDLEAEHLTRLQVARAFSNPAILQRLP